VQFSQISLEKQNTITLDGVELVPWGYETASGLRLKGYCQQDSGKPLLHFVHGNGFNCLVYWPLLRRLTDSFDLILTHAQGHGGGDAGEHFAGWNHNAAMLTEVISAFQQEWRHRRWIGVGHSFGGVLTSFVATLQPQMFERLVLLDPVFLPKSFSTAARLLHPLGVMHQVPMVKQARNRTTFWPAREAARKAFYQRRIFRGWDDECLDAYVNHALVEDERGVHLQIPPWLEAEIFARFPKGVWKAVADFSLPVDIFYGEKTYPFVKRGLMTAARKSQYVQLHPMPGDHCFMQQCPAKLSDSMLSLLADDINRD
jgi:pimeloyl-ACP methyl ester carboxylesterase